MDDEAALDLLCSTETPPPPSAAVSRPPLAAATAASQSEGTLPPPEEMAAPPSRRRKAAVVASVVSNNKKVKKPMQRLWVCVDHETKTPFAASTLVLAPSEAEARQALSAAVTGGSLHAIDVRFPATYWLRPEDERFGGVGCGEHNCLETSRHAVFVAVGNKNIFPVGRSLLIVAPSHDDAVLMLTHKLDNDNGSDEVLASDFTVRAVNATHDAQVWQMAMGQWPG